MTDVILGSHTRTYEFKRVEEQSFCIAVRGGGGGKKGEGREVGRFCLRLLKVQIHTSEILDSQKYITYRLREIYHFYVCLSEGNHFTGDVYLAWAACVYGTTGRLGYHSINWCSYNWNTWLRRSMPAVCLHSTATTRELYLEEN